MLLLQDASLTHIEKLVGAFVHAIASAPSFVCSFVHSFNSLLSRESQISPLAGGGRDPVIIIGCQHHTFKRRANPLNF